MKLDDRNAKFAIAPRPPIAITPIWTAMLASTLWLATAAAALPHPPGGPHRLHRGGDNQAGFPPLTYVAVDDSLAQSQAGRLFASAAPNPSRGDVHFRVQVPRGGGQLRVRLFSVNGRRVREWRNAVVSGGWIEWRWDGRDQRGLIVANGMYFYIVDIGAQRVSGRLILLR